jgi:uncharacterized membrane protein
MPTTQSNRGRPVILEKTELNLGDGNDAIMRLVGDGTVVQLELPRSWSLERLERSITRTGGRTKVQFSLDPPETPPAPEPAPAPAPVETKIRATRKRAAKPEAPVAPPVPAASTSNGGRSSSTRRRTGKKVTATS